MKFDFGKFSNLKVVCLIPHFKGLFAMSIKVIRKINVKFTSTYRVVPVCEIYTLKIKFTGSVCFDPGRLNV